MPDYLVILTRTEIGSMNVHATSVMDAETLALQMYRDAMFATESELNMEVVEVNGKPEQVDPKTLKGWDLIDYLDKQKHEQKPEQKPDQMDYCDCCEEMSVLYHQTFTDNWYCAECYSESKTVPDEEIDKLVNEIVEGVSNSSGSEDPLWLNDLYTLARIAKAKK